MNLPRVFSPSALSLSVAALACAGDDPGPTPQPTPASIVVQAGNAQTGAPGQALAVPLAVIVRDASAAPLGGVTVSWAAASGGGVVSPTSSMTDAAGIATTNRTLGALAGPLTTTATVAGLAPVSFTALGLVQGATSMGSRFQSPLVDTVLATTVAQPLIAVVLNQGTPVPGVIVAWTATGGGQVSQAVDTTDAGGESQVDYTFAAAAGTYGAQASVAGLLGSPVAYTLTAGPGNPAVLVKTGGDNLTVAPGAQVVHTVTARDAHGNPTNGVQVDWAVGAGGGTIAPAQNITGSGGNGIATATRTLGAGLGDQTATATATGLSGSPATFTTTAAVVVQVANNTFTPGSVSVAQNQTVTWQWQGTTSPHNVTFASVSGAPARIFPDMTTGSASRTFTVTGTFNYSCTNHPGMTGSVTVTP